MLSVTSHCGVGEEIPSAQQGTIGQEPNTFPGDCCGNTLSETPPGLCCVCPVTAGEPGRMGETLGLQSGNPSFNITSGTWGGLGALSTSFHSYYKKREEEMGWFLRGPPPTLRFWGLRPPRSCAHFPLPCKCRLFTFQLAGSAVIAFGLWFRFGGTMKDFSSEDSSPEYFYIGE